MSKNCKRKHDLRFFGWVQGPSSTSQLDDPTSSNLCQRSFPAFLKIGPVHVRASYKRVRKVVIESQRERIAGCGVCYFNIDAKITTNIVP